jgi:hypothetical protein
MIEFEILAPVVIPTQATRSGAKRIDPKDFWNIYSNDDFKNLPGCYVFCIKAAKGSLPWYVGKTKNLRGYEGEIFSADKLNKYHSVLMDRSRGIPFFYFVAQNVNRGGNESAIFELETYLIQTAYERNPALINKQKLGKNSRVVRGCVGGGKGTASGRSVSFRQIMGMD